jgi:two-component sensor histidine kinase
LRASIQPFPCSPGCSSRIRTSRSSAGYIERSVIDDGIGLPLDYDERRPDNAGMSILWCLSSQLGGSIRPESRDPGLAVHIAFPAERRESFDARVEPRRAEPRRLETIVTTAPVDAT